MVLDLFSLSNNLNHFSFQEVYLIFLRLWEFAKRFESYSDASSGSLLGDGATLSRKDQTKLVSLLALLFGATRKLSLDVAWIILFLFDLDYAGSLLALVLFEVLGGFPFSRLNSPWIKKGFQVFWLKPFHFPQLFSPSFLLPMSIVWLDWHFPLLSTRIHSTFLQLNRSSISFGLYHGTLYGLFLLSWMVLVTFQITLVFYEHRQA